MYQGKFLLYNLLRVCLQDKQFNFVDNLKLVFIYI